MKRLCLLLGLALAAPLVTAGPASAQLNGEIRMTIHTHSNPDPNWPGLLFPSDRLSYNFVVGEDFSYSSRTCGGPAPFNDLGLNFTPNYPGVDDDADSTAPVRHRVQGTITAVSPNGNEGSIQGKITTVLCAPGPNATQVETEHSIVSYFHARFLRISNNALQVWGSFQISPTESTGTFRDMQGGGRLEGRFTCLGHQGNPSQPSCAQLGYYTDFVGHSGDPTLGPGRLQPGLVGTFYDPTIQTTGSAA
ncbi:MAG: hypothetical protein M3314_01870 [Actinomycetota bacterium]|nr:hypothetical protein [Actinomycetota bacterium]